MIRGAIFDVDGTLLDSMPIWRNVNTEYLRSLGIEPREDLWKTFKTFTMQQSARYYQDVYGVTLSEQEIIDGINGMIENFYRHQAQPKPGISEFLENLRKNGVKMCIATATDRYLIEIALKRSGLLHFFSEIFTCRSVGHSKNEPHIYREAMKHLGTCKEETFVFEDALHAAQTAKNDGFPVIGIYDISEDKTAELKSFANLYLTDFSDFSAFWKTASH